MRDENATFPGQDFGIHILKLREQSILIVISTRKIGEEATFDSLTVKYGI